MWMGPGQNRGADWEAKGLGIKTAHFWAVFGSVSHGRLGPRAYRTPFSRVLAAHKRHRAGAICRSRARARTWNSPRARGPSRQTGHAQGGDRRPRNLAARARVIVAVQHD